MDPSDYLRALRKRWVVIAVLALVGASVGYAIAATTTPVYRATTKVFVSLQGGETVSELVQGSTYTQNLVQSYVALATMPVVLDPVIDELGLDTTSRTMARTITAEAPINTVIVEIAATDSSPAQAALVADAVAEQLAVVVEELSASAGTRSETVSMRTVAPADVPRFPIAPNTRFLVATGLLAGLVIGVVFALARELLDTKVRESKDVARVTDAAVLGSIGARTRLRDAGPVMQVEPHSQTAEAYRRLRTNLRFLDFAGPLHSVVVTSPLPGDGKSTTSTNLALSLAEGPARVLLVDADLRRPSVAEYLGLEGSVGLTTVLIGGADLHEVVQPYGEGNLDVLPSGAIPPNPTQLLSSPAMVDLLAQMVASYDLVILDSPPLLPVADSAILARLADGALVVAAARKTRRPQLAEAIGSLNAVGAVCLGVVLNRVARRETEGYYGYAPEELAAQSAGRGRAVRRKGPRRRRPDVPEVAPGRSGVVRVAPARAPGGLVSAESDTRTAPVQAVPGDVPGMSPAVPPVLGDTHLTTDDAAATQHDLRSRTQVPSGTDQGSRRR
ncbi:polysaccharide biosynthesis tyrosine autokinase [Cellulomonas aerilata]|uniref:non-specific protein-tyrosine kinase n=1 Tax=Cellulomonas aerilata TaxID=515326 RepID=A0A512DDU6_9CELL|nr:polysaccharide biosynthesis tyrosine autokinase [Cellulomonas aerilata]GEO34646.1 chromosome partitioning protein [Cellulomonas aerilata]